jgi:uncharacterized protein DUF6982
MTRPGSMIVARYADGRMIKGVTQDFSVDKPEFHVFEDGNESAKAIAVPVADLKAVFFVRTYAGNKAHQEYKLFDRAKVKARKILVSFHDGEKLVGLTLGYNASKQGFFVTPADPDTNNTRVYVVNRAVRAIHWI